MAACRTRRTRKRAIAGARPPSSATRQTSRPRKAGRTAKGRNRAGHRGRRARQAAAAPGRAQSLLHDDHLADRRRGRQPHPARRAIRPGRHAVDVAGAVERRLCHREFKETQLSDVREGQPVDIEVDMFPGKSVHGHVDSWRPPAARNSRCCRRTTPPAISPRWCSASPSRSR